MSDPRYDGCEGLVLPQGRGEARGRIGVEMIYGNKELMYGAKKWFSVGCDKLLVLSPGHEASDEGQHPLVDLSFHHSLEGQHPLELLVDLVLHSAPTSPPLSVHIYTNDRH